MPLGQQNKKYVVLKIRKFGARFNLGILITDKYIFSSGINGRHKNNNTQLYYIK